MDKCRFEYEILPCYKRVFAICMAIVRDRDEASDAVQETFTRLWERRNELDDVSNPEAYAVTVAKRVCISRLKNHEIVTDEITSAAATNDADQLESCDELRLIKRLIGCLPDGQRKVIELSSFGGCSNDEISQITGDSPANVRQLLSRGRKKLKELYKLYTQ